MFSCVTMQLVVIRDSWRGGGEPWDIPPKPKSPPNFLKNNNYSETPRTAILCGTSHLAFVESLVAFGGYSM